jgi:hypothetical protein
MRRFRGVFRGGQDFFHPQIVLSAAKGNFVVKKVEKLAIMFFASIQKIISQTIRISRTLIFSCTGATIFPKCFRFIGVCLFLIVFVKFGKGYVTMFHW